MGGAGWWDEGGGMRWCDVSGVAASGVEPGSDPPARHRESSENCTLQMNQPSLCCTSISPNGERVGGVRQSVRMKETRGRDGLNIPLIQK